MPSRSQHRCPRSRVTIALSFSIATLAFDASAQPQPRWVGPVLFDADASDALRAREPTARRIADTLSWAAVGTVLAAPLAISARATVERRASAAALGESALSLALPYGSAVLLGLATKYAFARERPFATRAGLAHRCGRGRGDGAECEWDRNGSFFSLHAALAFAGAGMTCAHALRFVPDDAPLDAASCGMATLGATVGALLRMTADKHYATDVITGALVGLALSVGLGWGLHLSDRAPLTLAEGLATPTIPALGPRGDALAVTLGGAAGVIGGVLAVTAFSRQLQ